MPIAYNNYNFEVYIKWVGTLSKGKHFVKFAGTIHAVYIV